MGSRIALQSTLEHILGARRVYFNPPASLKLDYPCVIYSLNRITHRHADSEKYKRSTSYTVTLIDRNPDSEHVDKILALKYCELERHYTSDNLHHWVFNLYF